jgi:hypothetical protein
MTIRPIDLNGIIQRTQDVGNIKHQEDAKPLVDQQNIQSTVVKEENKLTKQVNHADDANQEDYRYDAKEKGNSEYHGNGGNKNKKKKEETGKVVVKNQSAGFDMKI